MSVCKITVCLLTGFILMGCSSAENKNSPLKTHPFKVQDIAKSDVDMVAEIQLRYVLESLKQLMDKLYRRNPRELLKGRFSDREAAVAQVFGPGRYPAFPQLKGKSSIDSIRLAFDEAYTGDRVLAFSEGLRSMILAAYNGKQEFYLMDELDPQKLYNAARNIETAVWMLSNRRDSQGRLFIISNETGGALNNLSYERLFGKVIALQDSMARIVAESTSRRIKSVIQSVASMVFLPI